MLTKYFSTDEIKAKFVDFIVAHEIDGDIISGIGDFICWLTEEKEEETDE